VFTVRCGKVDNGLLVPLTNKYLPVILIVRKSRLQQKIKVPIHEKGVQAMSKLRVMVPPLIILAFMMVLLSCAAGTKSESTGEYFDDSVITTKVKSLLVKDTVLKAFQISVETYRGVVQLSGFVNSQTTIDRAGEIARGVSGVKSVKNNLILK
jgi:hypothetical protein